MVATIRPTDRAGRLVAGGVLATTGLAVFTGRVNLGTALAASVLPVGGLLVYSTPTRKGCLYQRVGFDACRGQ